MSMFMKGSAARKTMAATTAAALLAGSGCVSTTSPDDPGEKAAFDATTAKLDKGGNFYAYFGTRQVFDDTRKVMDRTEAFAKTQVKDGQDAKDLDKAIKIIRTMITESGLGQIEGIGVSSIDIGDSLYRNVSFIKRKGGQQPDSLLWNPATCRNHKLDSLAMLPKNTIAAGFNNFQAKQAWDWYKNSIAKHDPKIVADMEAELKKQGVDMDEMIDSCGDEIGLIVTSDGGKKISVPLPTGILELPEMAFAMGLKVKNDKIFNLIKTKLPFLTAADTDECKKLTMSLSLFSVNGVAPTVSSFGEWLFISSNAEIVDNIIQTKKNGGGLTTTDEFKRLSKGLPDSGVGFGFAGDKTKTLAEAYSDSFMKAAGQKEGGMTSAIQKIFSMSRPTHQYQVATFEDDGFLTVANASVSTSENICLIPASILSGAMAGAISTAIDKKTDSDKKHGKGKADKKSPAAASSYKNLKMLNDAIARHADTHDGKFPEDSGAKGIDTLVKEKLFKSANAISGKTKRKPAAEGSPLTEDNCDYIYLGGFVVGDDPSTPVAFEKPAKDKKFIKILFINGAVQEHVDGQNGSFENCQSVVEMLKRDTDLSDAGYQKALEKAKACDKDLFPPAAK